MYSTCLDLVHAWPGETGEMTCLGVEPCGASATPVREHQVRKAQTWPARHCPPKKRLGDAKRRVFMAENIKPTGIDLYILCNATITAFQHFSQRSPVQSVKKYQHQEVQFHGEAFGSK